MISLSDNTISRVPHALHLSSRNGQNSSSAAYHLQARLPVCIERQAGFPFRKPLRLSFPVQARWTPLQGPPARTFPPAQQPWLVRDPSTVRLPMRLAPPVLPVVVPVSDRALSALLPLSGTGEQVLQQLGGPSTWIRRAVVSIAGAMLLYNINVLLTVVAAFYWAWSPMFSAAQSNTALRLKYRHVGLWRARIEKVQLVQPQGATRQMLRVLIGDDSGARVEMEVEVPGSPMVVRRGEPAELLVLSDRPNFSRFRALREVFLPAQGAWIAERPYVERAIFAEMSVEMATLLSGQEEEEVDWEAQYTLASTDHAQDLENYTQYNMRRQPAVGSGGGSGSSLASEGWESSSCGSFCDDGCSGAGCDVSSWGMAEGIDTELIPEAFRDHK